MTDTKKADFDTFSKIAIEGGETALREVLTCIDVITKTMLENATTVSDMVVTPEQEQRKIDYINMWRDTADRLKQMTEVMHFGFMPATEFRDELVQLMLKRTNELAGANTATDVEIILRERCNNAAMGFSDRVVREL